jgi:hypothetical protein
VKLCKKRYHSKCHESNIKHKINTFLNNLPLSSKKNFISIFLLIFVFSYFIFPKRCFRRVLTESSGSSKQKRTSSNVVKTQTTDTSNDKKSLRRFKRSTTIWRARTLTWWILKIKIFWWPLPHQILGCTTMYLSRFIFVIILEGTVHKLGFIIAKEFLRILKGNVDMCFPYAKLTFRI